MTMIVEISREKYSSARFPSPSPSVFETSAQPPVPSMKPNAPTIMISGMMMLMDDSALAPTMLETNIPSTTL